MAVSNHCMAAAIAHLTQEIPVDTSGVNSNPGRSLHFQLSDAELTRAVTVANEQTLLHAADSARTRSVIILPIILAMAASGVEVSVPEAVARDGLCPSNCTVVRISGADDACLRS
jgi:hypothetical protein